jgi:Zn-dependent M32 family carboxypeptidase
VHRWGRAFEPAELLERVVGGALDPGPELAYLRRKVAALDEG